MARYPQSVLNVDVALIGGTGIGHRLAALGGKPILVPTRYGPFRGNLFQLPEREDSKALSIVAVERHSAGHKTPPHAINFKAIARGLYELNVKGCFSTAASGSLNGSWPVGTITVCTDFIDQSSRNITMFEHDVEHHDFTTPFTLAPYLQDAATKTQTCVEWPCNYLCVNGPRYETPAEIKMFGEWGADLVGMTAASEATCLRELGIPYGLLGIVTNAAAGLGDEELSHGDVSRTMETCGQTVVDLLLEASRLLVQNPLR